MNPFTFPKSRQVRREKPGSLAKYQHYKPFLRREFESKCVYCRAPDTMSRVDSFGIDHYRPKVRFPELELAYRNLFYSCNVCNRKKGSYWPNRGQVGTHFIPNPVDHEMFKHLRFEGGIVVAKTEAGAKAIEIMDLNEPQEVDRRLAIINAIALNLEKQAEWEGIKAHMLKRKTTLSSAQKGDDERLRVVAGHLEAIERDLARLGGMVI